MANITIKHIINEGTLTISGANIEPVSIASTSGETIANPFTNGLVTKDATLKDSNGVALPRNEPKLTINANGSVTIDTAGQTLTNLTLICYGA